MRTCTCKRMSGLEFKVLVGVSAVAVVALVMASAFSTRWLVFTVNTKIIHPSSYWSFNDDTLIDVNVGLWKMVACNSTGTSSNNGKVFQRRVASNPECHSNTMSQLMSFFDDYDPTNHEQAKLRDVVSILMSLQMAMITAIVISTIGLWFLASYFLCKKVNTRIWLSFYCCWYTIVFFVLTVLVVCEGMCLVYMNDVLKRYSSPQKKVVYEYTLTAITIEARLPIVVYLIGVAALVSGALGLSFLVITRRLNRARRLAEEDGLPENLSDLGPVVSCSNEETDLETFLNKARQEAERQRRENTDDTDGDLPGDGADSSDNASGVTCDHDGETQLSDNNDGETRLSNGNDVETRLSDNNDVETRLSDNNDGETRLSDTGVDTDGNKRVAGVGTGIDSAGVDDAHVSGVGTSKSRLSVDSDNDSILLTDITDDNGLDARDDEPILDNAQY